MAAAAAMGRGSRSAMLVFLGTVAVLLLSCKGATATGFRVGGDSNWTIPGKASNGKPFYQDWASSHNFTVGDTLEFIYNKTIHNVQPVNDFVSCSNYTTSRPAYTGGSTNITLNTTGLNVFVCTVPRHCDKGMLLQLNVSSNATAPAPSSATPRLAGVIGTVAAVVFTAASFFM